MDDEAQRSLLLWVQSFQDSIAADASVTSLTDLCDGVFLAKIMHKIDPEYLNMELINEQPAGNWALKASNVKALLRSVELYYHEELGQLCDANDLVDAHRVAKENDAFEAAKLAELVLGCAVQCPSRSAYIHPILQMDATAQASMMHLIESIMHRFQLASPSNSTTASARESPRHNRSFAYLGHDHEPPESLAMQLTQALSKVSTLELRVLDVERDKREFADRLETAEADKQRLAADLATVVAERDQLLSERQSTLTRDNKKLQQLVDGELHALTGELDAKRDELERVKRDAAERLAVLEHEVRRQADELDIARSKLAGLAKLEASNAKYRAKLDELPALRAQIRELETHNATYLDKVLDLESTVKTMPTLKALVERYKNQVVDLETANVEAVSNNQVKDQRVRRLQDELDSALGGNEFLESQLDEVRSQLASLQQQFGINGSGGASIESSGVSADLLVGRESIGALRERVARLERENAQLQSGDVDAATTHLVNELDVTRKQKESLQFTVLQLKQQTDALHEQLRLARSGSSGSSAASAGITTTGATIEATGASAHDSHTMPTSGSAQQPHGAIAGVPGLAPALGAVQSASAPHLIGTSSSSSSNAGVMSHAPVDATVSSGVATAQVAVYEEKIQKLQAEAEVVDSMRVTVAELTNRLKDKESVINELSEQRAKLENYTKKTLHAVQTKYMVAVSSHRNQISEKQERVDVLEQKLKEMRTSYSREQALMMSSFYEIGTEMQRRTMLPQSQTQGAGAGSWLASKRSEERAKRRNF